MGQRYFLTAESTYEDLRQTLNVQLAYPNALGKSVFQTALYAPRDGFRRVLLAVDTDLPNYATIDTAISPLLASDAMEEIDEAGYLAAVASATGGGGGVSSWNDLTDKPATFPAASHTHSALDIQSGTLDAARLPVATANAIGGVRIGSGISIDGSGVISASASYTLPNATTTTLGGVIVGTGLQVSSGTVSLSANARQASDNFIHPFLLAGM